MIIPCYRNFRTLQRAVDSVRAQTLQPAQLVLIDDASFDGTREMIQRLAAEQPDWIDHVLLDSNRGASGARNAGWAQATQPYIAFLDADDAWHPQKLAVQYSWMRMHPNIVICGHQCAEHRPEFETANFNRLTYSADVFSLHRILVSNPLSTPSVMLRRDISQRFPEQQTHSEDFYLWLSIAAKHGPVYRIKAMLAWFYKPAVGRTGLSSALWKMERGELWSMSKLRQDGTLSLWQWGVFSLFSMIKFLVRLLRVRFRKA